LRAHAIIGALRNDSDAGIAEQLDRRRRAAAEQWGLSDEVVVIGAGDLIPVPGRGDRTYPYRSHSEYFYLTDRERPGGILAFDQESGWVDFVAPVTALELLWRGADGAKEGVPEGTEPVSQVSPWLEERRGRPIANLGGGVPGVSADGTLSDDLRYALNHVRRQKDEVELYRMREAERATAAGFAAIAPLLEPGRTEREVQIALESVFLSNGADFLAFETIVGSGPNSAVLHKAPDHRPFGEGELVLIDAGGEYRGYASDITRTYPVSGSFSPEQSELHALVRAAGAAAIERCRPGVEWKEVHRTAALVVAGGLVAFGLLRGAPETLFEQGAVKLFFPHGIGHMVGLGIRDAGEVLRDRQNSEPEPGFPPIRVDLPLLPGHVFTVEPGIYFVPAILRDPEHRERQGAAVDWARVDRMLTFGGIRVEENILITEDGCEVLTANVPVPD
jgi:Xaa-Pro aminopeptidase